MVVPCTHADARLGPHRNRPRLTYQTSGHRLQRTAGRLICAVQELLIDRRLGSCPSHLFSVLMVPRLGLRSQSIGLRTSVRDSPRTDDGRFVAPPWRTARSSLSILSPDFA